MASESSPEIKKEVDNVVAKVEPSEELYFTKDGRTRTGPKAPTAYAWSYPWPPCPTNLCKNKVFRPKEEDFKKVAEEVKQEFEKEANPLGILEIEGKPLSRMPVPEIELALYWDKHPFEFRPSADLNKRAKSAINLSLASSVGDLLQFDQRSTNQEPNEVNTNNNQGDNRRSRGASADSVERISRENKSRYNSASTINSRRKHSESKRNSHTPLHGINNSDIEHRIQQSNSNQNNKSKSSSPAPTEEDTRQESQDEDKSSSINSNPRMPKILQILNQNEKKKFDDIPRRQSNGSYNPPKLVRDLSRSFDRTKSIGVQATIDGLTSAALKSTYSCPLHGCYQRGVERRAKSGFRTDMSSTVNPHARCSRSRTKFLRDTEIQTEDVTKSKKNGGGSETRKPRSKTAGANSSRLRGQVSNKNMVSEYHGNFRHPGHIAESENRRLRNKILSYCFTKQSIF